MATDNTGKWKKVLENDMNLNVMLNTLPTKGNLVYEYNPFRNYRLSENRYYYKGDYLTLEDLEDEGVTLSSDKQSWLGVPNGTADPELYERGLLVDFITDELKLSLDHPVHIVPLYSYDGSVNLIINDGLNTPRLINSRFSATGRNTYEIIDRKGSNDTNIYDLGELFDIDTSLYKIVDKIPKIKFLGTSAGGNLKVGNYYFYFKFADADGNETDFIGESGLVSVFIGEGSYGSVHTGTKNENSTKLVEFSISNMDTAYDYIIVYYSRSSAEYGDNEVIEYKKITRKYNKSYTKLVITGFEDTEDITVSDINLNYNLVNSVLTSAVCLNMLFMGNIKKQDIPYEELQDLSLRILPFLGSEKYDPEINETYNAGNTKKSYINSKFIYDKTGYWPNELYRFGIVYILPNGLLTPVFNVRGGIGIGLLNRGFLDIPLKEENKRYYLKYNESSNYLSEPKRNIVYKNGTDIYTFSNYTPYDYENVKGVCSFSPVLQFSADPDIYYIDFYIPADVKTELKNYVKGYFFVRQPRMPLVLALGITLGIDRESRTPTIPTAGGVLARLQNVLPNSHVETENINGLNYITEGFLKRYSFTFKKKSSSLWGKIGKIMGVAALVIGGLAASIVTGGGSLVGSIALVGTITGAVGTSIGAVAVGLIAGAAAGVAAGAVTGLVASALELGQAVARIGEKKRLNGKATKAPSGYKLVETEDSRTLTSNFDDRIIIKDDSKNEVQCIICPDYTINQAYYNQIFTGNEHLIETDFRQSLTVEAFSRESYFTNKNRHFYIDLYTNVTSKSSIRAKIIGVPDNIICTGIDDVLFRSRAGEAEEAWRYKCVAEEITSTSGDNYLKINTDIVRGSFGPYLGTTNNIIGPAKIVNIFIPGYDSTNMDEYIGIRMNDNSVYNAITDRIDINDYTATLVGDLNSNKDLISAYRGDCYICLFTQRINRNFNDPSAPYNELFVDTNTWKDNYDPSDAEKNALINSGDINAVPLGMWVTFQLRSTNNLNIRTLDNSNVDETAMTGHPSGYYPVQPMSVEGVYKKPESQIYNKGFKRSLGDRWNFELPDVPHIKNWFGTRIMYSDVHINDGFKNGFRVFLGTHYRDYTREYGSITKLIPFESSLLCIFEHGIALIPVNERAIAGQGAGGNVYINTSNVLPENPKIISDMFGSQWPESILKVPGRTGDAALYVYGVDTVAKKIWRTDGTSILCISDFKVLEFLNNNITLGERELTPKIGIRNVKTHYNAFKRDVMFTFYDNTYGFEEKVWNLCWNEILLKFITFYSWVPSYMENINNIPFSFDRNTSKWIAKLGTSHAENSFSDGITLTNVIIEDALREEDGPAVKNLKIPIRYLKKDGSWRTLYADATDVPKFIAGISLNNRILPDSQMYYRVDFTLERDVLENYKLFKIVPLTTVYEGVRTENGFILPEDAMFPGAFMPLYALCFESDSANKLPVYYRDGDSVVEVRDVNGDFIYTHPSLANPSALYSELYYRNSAGNAYADYDTHKLGTKNIGITYLPMDLEASFGEEDFDMISNLTGLTYDEAEAKYKGESKSWIKDGDTLALFMLMYPPETPIGNNSTIYNKNNPPLTVHPCTTIGEISNIMYYNGNTPMVHGIRLDQHWVIGEAVSNSERKVWYDLPIFKDITGKRPLLPKDEQINPDRLVTLLNIKATISIMDLDNINTRLSDTYYNMKASYASGTSLINAGLYESVVAITPRWNLLFLSTDFWKHGLAGLIDIADDIYPTYWYGKQHPFEFEVIVVNDPSTHKIFLNLELVANKAKPESFHYEIIGECYDFAKDKVNMYFRLEAMKALWQYNGADISYNRNFLKVQPKQLFKSADFPHTYYTRLDTINDIEDYYIHLSYPAGHDYRHLSGAEIVYYPTRQEYRVWNHAKAVDIDDLSPDDSRSVISANCKYLEDRWKITINPIIICYKNEYSRDTGGVIINGNTNKYVSTWSSPNRPKLPVMNSPIPNRAYEFIKNHNNEVEIPEVLSDLGYTDLDMDMHNWLNDVNIYKTNFGAGQNRKELDIKDKFIKVRIRYSGEELAVIDFLNTIYRISYA